MGTGLDGFRLLLYGYKYRMAATAFEEQTGHGTRSARHRKQAFWEDPRNSGIGARLDQNASMHDSIYKRVIKRRGICTTVKVKPQLRTRSLSTTG